MRTSPRSVRRTTPSPADRRTRTVARFRPAEQRPRTRNLGVERETASTPPAPGGLFASPHERDRRRHTPYTSRTRTGARARLDQVLARTRADNRAALATDLPARYPNEAQILRIPHSLAEVTDAIELGWPHPCSERHTARIAGDLR